MTTEPIVLEARGITKHYGSIVAVESVSLSIQRGEVLGLVGDNGAGKSTLVKLLTGAVQPDSGELFHRGERVTFQSPSEARAVGIECVWQELALAQDLDVAGNIYLGREIARPRALRLIGLLNRRAMARGAAARMRDLKISLPAITGLPCGKFSGGQRQAVAVARAAAWATDVLFMDEPTAALGVTQAEAVLTLAKRAAEQGLAVVIISHNLPNLLEFTDRIIVLRHGRKVADMARSEVTEDRLVALIVGFESVA